MCSTSSARWCGLPAQQPRPLRCGVLVYLHVPKTGGSAVTQFLREHVSRSEGTWWLSTVTAQRPWKAIVAHIRKQRRPKHIVVHHVEATTSLSNASLNHALLAPLQCWLASKGCQLIRTTTLREASARAMSAAFYNHVPQAMYRSWVAEHSSNGMVSFLLHNRLRLRRRNLTLPMNDQSLQRAQAFLATFDAVGRTEDLSAFIRYIHGHLGNSSSSTSQLSRQQSANLHENVTPERFKYILSPGEREWTQERSALDRLLYESLCNETGRCPLPRKPSLMCGAGA
jgi:hypothetical protein